MCVLLMCFCVFLRVLMRVLRCRYVNCQVHLHRRGLEDNNLVDEGRRRPTVEVD